MSDAPVPHESQKEATWAMPTLVLGALAIGFSPIFVRLSEVGPIATAFNRVVLALPFFYFMVWLQPKETTRAACTRAVLMPVLIGGVFFATDLSFWHWSIKLTSVANATVLPNFAPVVVVIAAWLLYGEKVSRGFVAGLTVAMAGIAVLLGNSFTLSAAHFVGDLLGLSTSLFYGGYILAIARARRAASTTFIMAVGGTVSAIILWVVAAAVEGQVWPQTAHGWMIALLQSATVQAGGQALIAASLAHVPAGFGATVLLLQPVVAALVAWLMFNEPLSAWQALGAVAILGGVEIARRASAK
ncbi:MAG: DMT family transporter [Rhodospirillaceae bacterium]|nr:DMT family transporter [Rhodospirillaceae bacterium]